MAEKNGLSINFHQTFRPEREYLSQILKVAQKNESFSNEQITDETGIPTGKSSGKVIPTINYAKGMYLIETKKNKDSIHMSLTPLGEMILIEDKYFSESLTQWVLHLFLSRKSGGAKIWYKVFCESTDVLGNRFSRVELDNFLESFFGKKNRSLIGPLVTMYNSSSSFNLAKCLYEKDNELIRNIAPLKDEYIWGYAAIFAHYWETFYSDKKQLTLDEFEEQTSFFKLMGWDEQQMHECINKFSELKIIEADRQMGSPIISIIKDEISIVKNIFSLLV
jgi:hypothetical protein